MKNENTSRESGARLSTLTRDKIPCDPRLARTISTSYYGELAAISGYIYRAILSEVGCPALSELFESIAIEEMHHFRLLGRLIRLLGGNPTIRTNLSVPSVNPCELSERACESFRRMIAESIREEEGARAEYERLASCTTGYLSTIFRELASDEERHIRSLKSFSV